MKKLIIIFLFITSVLKATDSNYYVDNTGTGDTLATIAEVNALTLATDDTVFFKKGCSWRETLTIPNSGTSGHYIVFTSYSTGLKPIILGSNQALTFTDQGGNVWSSATTLNDPYNIGTIDMELFFDESGIITWGVHKTDTSLLIAEYDWTWLANKIYVYAATDPDSRYTSVEVPQRATIVNLNSKQYLEFNGLDLHYSVYGIQEVYPTANLTGLNVKNCRISHLGTKNGGGYGTHFVYSNSVFEGDTIYDCGRRGISLNHYGNSTITNITIQNCIFYNGYHTTGVDISNGAISSTGTIDTVIIKNSLFYEPAAGTSQGNQIFIQDYSHGITTPVKNVYIYCNIFKYNSSSSIMMEGATSVFIYNNTFYENNTVSAVTNAINVNHNNLSVKIKNNIFYTTLAVDANYRGCNLYCLSTQDYTKVEVDYNIHYRTTNALRTVRVNSADYHMNDLSLLQAATGWETHGQFIDPTFVSSVDYHLQAGSPAIAAGIGVGLNLDYEGNAWEATPSIGAYEYNASPPDPPGLPEVETMTNQLITYAVRRTLSSIWTSNGGGTLTAVGICLSTSVNPTTSDIVVLTDFDNETPSIYQCTFYNLSGGITYHYRAFATNESGTAYGADMEFETPENSVNMSGGNVVTNSSGLVIIAK
mgnify:CR=1 FL=1